MLSAPKLHQYNLEKIALSSVFDLSYCTFDCYYGVFEIGQHCGLFLFLLFSSRCPFDNLLRTIKLSAFFPSTHVDGQIRIAVKN